MMVANLVGFVIGVDGVRYLTDQLTSTIDGESSNASQAASGRGLTDARRVLCPFRAPIHRLLMRMYLYRSAGHVRI